ncbi:MAG: SPOR domain-containing protein [Novosphingobium sp.]|nr:SPOR domain-containing protein [Novosphingobium sp.]
MTMSDNERDEDDAGLAQADNAPAEDTDQPADVGQEEGELAGEEPAEETGQLDLGDEDTALPWLEGDDEEEYESGNPGQLILLVLLGLLAIGLVVGGIWWMSRGSTDGELVADGSVIEAPDKPYKEKPEDPGGKTFEGTGDTSFVVSQGETRPARLGEAPSGSEPGFAAMEAGSGTDKPKPSPSASASPVPAAPPSAADSKTVGVQVGAFSTRETAESGWGKLSAQYSALSGLRYRIVEGQADIGRVYRLQALAADAAEAKALCNRLRSSGLNCQVKN